MAADEKLYMAIMRGMQDNNIKFRELQRLLDALGFDHRIKGDHFIYYYGNLPEKVQGMYKYERIIYWSDADDAFLVEVPELPGCMADGKTVEEAIANSEVIIKEWIEVTKERGLDVPEPKGRLMYA